jgi:hypothetical protein
VHWHLQVVSRAGRLRTAEIFGEIVEIVLESVAESIIEEVRAHPVGPYGTPPDGLWLRAERPRAAAGCAQEAHTAPAPRPRRLRSARQRSRRLRLGRGTPSHRAVPRLC